MALFSFRNRGNRRSLKTKRPRHLTFENLEPRHLLAGIFFNAGNGELTIAGDAGANSGSLVQLSPSLLRANLNGTPSQNFNVSEVSKLIFIGFGGNDSFTNSTAVESLLLGQDGNDTLVGGSGFDKINGGQGDDIISGNEGNDQLIAGFGNDKLSGGDGNDRMFGNAGLNEINGNNGDDVVFGGVDADTINGGEGMDKLYGRAGDDIISSGNGGILGSFGAVEADFVLGLDGNDTITGGNGLNVFYGGNGNDTLIGGAQENRMHGQNGDDTLTGGAGADYLAGNLGNDTISGLGGKDFILPGFGNDTVNGGGGIDFVVFNAKFSDYQITSLGSGLEVYDTRGVDGTDNVNAAEKFRFSDGDRPAEPVVTRRVTVQPIVTANGNGSNPAEFFGNTTQEMDIKQKVDSIFYQAGIDIQWLNENTWNNTFANTGSGGTRPTSDLGTVVAAGDAAGKGSSNPLIIDLYFVEIAAGYGDTGENNANGLAFVGGNGITAHVGDNLVGFSAGRDAVARVIAHEIAHNLGLSHVADANNLMSSGSGQNLNMSQINNIRDSAFAATI